MNDNSQTSYDSVILIKWYGISGIATISVDEELICWTTKNLLYRFRVSVSNLLLFDLHKMLGGGFNPKSVSCCSF